MTKLKVTSNLLLNAIRDLTMSIANTKMDNLSHLMATRTSPVKKCNNGVRPVGVGEIIRRVCLKIIDRIHRIKVITSCNNPFENGQTLGAEAIVHAIPKTVRSKNTCVLAIDASNGFNAIKRCHTLDSIYDKVPELYLTAWNVYKKHSYTIIKDTMVTIEEGSTQGCSLVASFSNLGISPLLD